MKGLLQCHPRGWLFSSIPSCWRAGCLVPSYKNAKACSFLRILNLDECSQYGQSTCRNETIIHVFKFLYI